jgi:hypothetical protein
MRMLLAVVAAAATVVHTGASAPHPQTVLTIPSGRIEAFAQDGALLTWFSADEHACNTVFVYSLVDGVSLQLPLQGVKHPNVTCRWPLTAPVRLALAGGAGSTRARALWTLRETAPLRFDYVLGAGIVDRNERRFQEIAHAHRGAGLWLGGIAGDHGTLVYAVTAVNYVDEVACLANPNAKRACALERAGGGIYRIVGRTPELVKGTAAAVLVAAASGRVAYAPTASIAQDGRPLAGTRDPLEIRDVRNGSLVCSVHPKGRPIAIALSSTLFADLERTPLGLRLAWYAAGDCAPRGSVPVPLATSPELSASGRRIVFRDGRSIRVADAHTNAVRGVARAAATPIGLSIEGARIAWGENVRGHGRIRELLLATR